MNLREALPQTDGAIRVQGITADVEVVRDRWGVPHIRARAVADAFFAQGFVHAQDRLWHMEWDRRRAYGRTAELIGHGGVEADRLARRFQIERASLADWQNLNAETREMLDAYTAGVNAFLAENAVPSLEFKLLHLKPEPWRALDCLSIFKIRHILMGVLFNKIFRLKVVLRLGPERAAGLFIGYREGQPLIIPPDEVYRRSGPITSTLEAASQLLPSAGGSNNWVVDGTRTKSGKPLLAGDPHRAIDVPNVYYQNHLKSDEFDVIGVSFPGVPGFPHLGHNDRVGWAITHAGADYQDLYLERFDPQDASRYEFNGAWLTAELSDEQIFVRGDEPVGERVRRTRHGPLIEDGPWPDFGIALHYTALDPGKTFECFLPIMRARSVEALREAQREWVDPAQNLIMADVDGHIGYHTRGRLPLRSTANGWLPVPGWTGDHEWQGTIPFEQMPQAADPATHFIITANNKIVDDSYPYFISVDAAPGDRATRLHELIQPLTGATADDFAAIQADRLSVPARGLMPHLLAIVPPDEPSSRALARLIGWDCRVEPDSVAATIYEKTRVALLRLLLEPIVGPELMTEMFSAAGGASALLGPLRSNLAALIEANDTRLLDPADPQRASWPAALQTALSTAVAELRAQLGDDMNQWQWARIHTTAPVHPLSVVPEIGDRLNPPRAPYGGDNDTVQAAGFAPALGYTISSSQCYRQIIDLGDLARSRWVVPLGASGHPGSPHYADQVAVWSANSHIPMLYDWQEIAAGAESVLRLSLSKADRLTFGEPSEPLAS
ncbi:MAG: penicillin acylase family protein [Chloroflexi bacterium]|nr:penicillin acylase family protein [Chloroflexota bacterium]